MTRPTQIGRTFPLITATGLGGTGGSVDGTQPDGQWPGSGQVPTSSGSNTWAWSSNVAFITSNTSNALLGPFVNFQNGTGIAFSVASNTLTIAATGSGASGGIDWFNVKSYGATGDGTTDDTSSINSAIAAWNSAGEGVLYFPAGTYKTTGALTTITASGVVRGDGMGAYDGSAYVSAVLCTSQTADLFTVTGKTVKFQDIGLFNTYAGTPTAGSAIQASGSFIGQKTDYVSIVVAGFYDCIDVQVGAQWAMQNCWVWGPVRYGIAIQNTVNQDAGDWAISDSYFYAKTYNATAAIYQTGSGGGKIANVKINGTTESFATGIRVAIPTAVETSVLTIASCSIENVTGDAIYVTTTGTGIFGMLTISGLEVGLYTNNTGRVVKLSAATAGTYPTTSGGLGGVVIDGVTCRTDGTARAAIELVNTDRVTLGDIQLTQNFTSRYTSSGDTNTTDGGGVTDHGALTGLADDDHTQYVLRNILTTKGDLFARTASQITRVAAGSNTGMALVTDANYVEGVRWGNTVGEILISDTPAGSPLVFSDLIQNEAQDDLLYADP